MKKFYIYAITHNRSGEVIYVGKTNNVEVRLKQHIGSKTSIVRRWIDANKLKSSDISINVLREVSEAECFFEESMHIMALSLVGVPLLNATYVPYLNKCFHKKAEVNMRRHKVLWIGDLCLTKLIMKSILQKQIVFKEVKKGDWSMRSELVNKHFSQGVNGLSI